MKKQMKHSCIAPRTEQIQLSAEYAMLAPASVGVGKWYYLEPWRCNLINN